MGFFWEKYNAFKDSEFFWYVNRGIQITLIKNTLQMVSLINSGGS